MCGFCGYVNNDNIENDKQILDMIHTLNLRGPNAQDTYLNKKVALAHSRLSIIDVKNGHQPMSLRYNNNEYIIVYNGELYNTKELKQDLQSKGYDFKTKCDTEVVLASYAIYKENCVDNFNGIYAFAIYDKKNNRLFLCRDRLGIKPLFYYYDKENKNFVFASEIKALLKHKDIHPVMDKEGLMELVGLGPAHSPSKTYFKNILEIKPGFYGYFDVDTFDFTTTCYWDLKTKEYLDDEKTTIDKIHYLVEDATKKQMVSDVGICSMLSGGLDSSILSKIANASTDDLVTFSVDYVGNDKDFTANDYQMTKDSEYVQIMAKFLQSKHKTILVENTKLYDYLIPSLIARDMPGMADIDSSMYAFVKEISRNGFKVCLSGECSDEIFGGYPWFYKEHLKLHDGFPWALSENLRDSLIKKGLLKKNELREYVETQRQNTLKKVEYLENEDEFDRRFRSINYLTIKWFMMCLIERTDRTSMANSLEVRVPYADHRIFEYLYNVSPKLKLGLTHSDIPIEKYLLRKAFENELPESVVFRKKSPYPKTYDPKYLELVEKRMYDIISNKDSKLFEIISKEYVQNLLNTHGKDLKENLFGQLMTYPQTIAYLIQIEEWLNLYNVEIEI